MIKVANKDALDLLQGLRKDIAESGPTALASRDADPDNARVQRQLQETMTQLAKSLIKTNELVAMQSAAMALVQPVVAVAKKMEATVHRDSQGRMSSVSIDVI